MDIDCMIDFSDISIRVSELFLPFDCSVVTFSGVRDMWFLNSRHIQETHYMYKMLDKKLCWFDTDICICIS